MSNEPRESQIRSRVAQVEQTNEWIARVLAAILLGLGVYALGAVFGWGAR